MIVPNVISRGAADFSLHAHLLRVWPSHQVNKSDRIAAAIAALTFLKGLARLPRWGILRGARAMLIVAGARRVIFSWSRRRMLMNGIVVARPLRKDGCRMLTLLRTRWRSPRLRRSTTWSITSSGVPTSSASFSSAVGTELTYDSTVASSSVCGMRSCAPAKSGPSGCCRPCFAQASAGMFRARAFDAVIECLFDIVVTVTGDDEQR